MAEFPALYLYTDAFMADTSHLSALESGAYVLLLFASWRTPDGGLPDDDVKLSRMARCDLRTWRRIAGVVMAFWRKGDDGLWRQKRLEIERRRARAKSESAAHAARVKHLKDKETQDADAPSPHVRNGCEIDATRSSTRTRAIEEEESPLTPPQGGLPLGDQQDGKRAPRKTRLPADWQPDPKQREYARKYGRDPDIARENFVGYWVGRGDPMADWNAVWQNYCRSGIDRGSAPRGHANGQPSGGRLTDGSYTGAVAFLTREGNDIVDDE